MKKVLLVTVVAAMAFTSCSQNEEFENAGQNAEISFNSIISKSARAAIVENDDFKSFTVNGYRTIKVLTADSLLKAGFMDNVPVAKNGNNWEQTGTFYWPATAYVSFFATSPAQTLNIASQGYPKFEYTVGDIDSQADLLAANLINQTKSDNKVTLGFRHLLTQVNFSIKGDTKDFKYVISKLKISGVSSTATYSFDGNESTVGSWGNQGNADQSYEYTFSTPKEITVTDLNVSTKLEVDKSSLFMLIPQTLTNAADVSITYYAIPNDKTSEIDKTFEGTKTVKLGTATNWEANKKVRYTLTLTSDAKSIEMGAPTVTAWDTADTDGGTIQPVTPSVE